MSAVPHVHPSQLTAAALEWIALCELADFGGMAEFCTRYCNHCLAMIGAIATGIDELAADVLRAAEEATGGR